MWIEHEFFVWTNIITINVPDDKSTIQEGIDFAWHGDTVLVADGIFSGPGNRDITFNGKTILPKNTKLIGTAQVVKTIDRVNVRFNTIVFPDGSEIAFSGIALWPDGSGGIKGKVKKHKAKLPAKILLKTASAGVGYATQSSVAEDITESITQDAEQEMSEEVDYSISIEKGTPILIFVDKRLEF